jgi:hypothetical protein
MQVTKPTSRVTVAVLASRSLEGSCFYFKKMNLIIDGGSSKMGCVCDSVSESNHVVVKKVVAFEQVTIKC